LFDKNTILYIVFVVYVIGAGAYFLFARRKQREKRETFFKAIFGAYKEGTLNNKEDLVNLFKGLNGEREESEVISGINRYLRLFLVELRTSYKYRLGEDVKIQPLISFINEQIASNEENQPFSDVPALERNYLKDIKKFVELNETEPAIDKLLDLGSLIQAREESLERLQKSNKWAVPLAVIGLVLTIIFGTLQLWS